MSKIKNWMSKILQNPQSQTLKIPPQGDSFRTRSKMKKLTDRSMYNLSVASGNDSQFGRVSLYRFLCEAIPVLNAAVWTWTSLAASPLRVEIVGSENKSLIESAESALERLFERIYDNKYQKFAGVPALLIEYFNSLFVTGCVAGEVVLNKTRTAVDYFYFVDSAGLGFDYKHGFWKIYQRLGERKKFFDLDSCYYYGLNADSVSPGGKSLLTSVPFVSRVEQMLVNDMHKSMHNAGYNRIHVKVTPPDRLAGESEKNYVSRANTYFEKTVSMFKDFRTEDNPITWDDVQIEYIGPGNKNLSSNSWYLNHKSILEDICAGLHLAPFMLGYSYGTTHNWAMFKYELVQREVRAVQMAASGFLEWLGNLELALNGL